MLSYFDDVSAANIDDRAADTLGRLNNDVVVLGHVERIELFDLSTGYVQNTLIDGIRHTVVDQLSQH